jgi:hypothetical protein
MKRELDPFESKLKEKLQGKAQFPEDLLWKRLNDELLRSDQQVASKNRYWILGAALLVFISLGTGYFIGVRQEASRNLAVNTASSTSKLPARLHSVSPSNQSTGIQALQKKETVNNLQGKQTNSFESLSKNELNRNRSLAIVKNQDQFYTIDLAQVNTKENIRTLPSSNVIVNANMNAELADAPSTQLQDLFDDFSMEKLTLRKSPLLLSSNTTMAKGSPYKKHFPTFLSASIGFQPTENNRFQTDRIYGSGSKFSGNEKGLSTLNVKVGLQAQLGRHFELGTGLGTANYVTKQTVQNQIVEIDPLVNQLNFESSISSFEINEDHLQDDPEDQEENELNFEDSTSFHLNYQLSNTIKSIQVPVTAGFVFQVNKYTFTLKTGFIFNHITQANQVLNISGFNAIRTNVQSQLVSNSFYQLFQVGAEFPVSSHVSLMLSPSYSHALKSISKSSTLRPNSLGLECALKFYF